MYVFVCMCMFVYVCLHIRTRIHGRDALLRRSLPLQVSVCYLIHTRGPQVPPHRGWAWGPSRRRSPRVPRAGSCLPPALCIRHPPFAIPRAAGTVGSLAGAQTLPFFARSSRVSRKLRQPRCLPRHPFLLLSLWQRREDNRRHFCLCGWGKRKDY